MSLVLLALVALAIGVMALNATLEARYLRGCRQLDAAWRMDAPAPLTGVGSTRSLAILPLLDWYPARPGLRGEAGISYLIKTDQATILLDVGLNARQEHPSPLLHNMSELGVDFRDIDTVVISHRHVDHVGGFRWLRRGTFSPGNSQPELGDQAIVVPVPMSYPGKTPRVAIEPAVLAPGVATTGVIAGQLYVGRVDEQALAVNVEGRGIVLIVGCGHQTLPRLIARTRRLFREPLYGIVGGLHYPVPAGRLRFAGIDVQNLVVFGPTHVPTRAMVQSQIESLAAHSPQWVSVSAHDSSDQTIEQFRTAFGERYHDLRVGEWQRIADAAPPAVPAHATRLEIA